jgi:hypothetical protein
MEIVLLWFILFLTLLILIFNIGIASFLANFVVSFEKRMDALNEEPPSNAQKTTRSMDSGLVDIEGAQTYDPRFLDRN